MNKKATENSIRTWFDRWYIRKNLESMRQPAAYPIYLDYLNAEAEKRLLDVGCGPGWLLKAGVKRGLDTYGFDFSEEAIKLSRQNSPESHCEVGEVTEIKQPEDFFDYISCIGVLEHFLNMDMAIAEMKRVAKPEALFCIMVPNSSTLFWKFSQIFSPAHRDSNENAMSLKQWKSFFTGFQFHIKAVFRDQWNIRKFYSLIGLGNSNSIVHVTQSIIRKLLPLGFSRQFIFILKDERKSASGEEKNG